MQSIQIFLLLLLLTFKPKSGVGFHKPSGKWRTRLAINGKSTLIGLFHSLKDAENAINAARVKFHGQFANNGVHLKDLNYGVEA